MFVNLFIRLYTIPMIPVSDTLACNRFQKAIVCTLDPDIGVRNLSQDPTPGWNRPVSALSASCWIAISSHLYLVHDK